MSQACLQVYTVDIGVAVGQSCMLLAAGAKGHRFMLEHATGEALAPETCVLLTPALAPALKVSGASDAPCCI